MVASVGAFGAEPKKAMDPDEAKARTLFSDGQKAYDVGQFPQALELYSEAYKLKPLPGFLFNIAQCHRQLGNYKEAAFAFGRFIDNSAPKAANVELARELIEDMKRRQAEKDAADAKAADERRAHAEAALKDAPVATHLTPDAAPPPPPPVVVVEDVPVYKRGWFWGVTGGVVVAAAAGITAAVLLSKPAKTYGTPNLADINGR